MLFLRSDPAMYTSPGRTYARVGVRDPARMYVRGRIFFPAHWPLYVRVHATCAPLLLHVHASTSTSMYVHVRDQDDNAMSASTKWVPTVREDKEALAAAVDPDVSLSTYSPGPMEAVP